MDSSNHMSFKTKIERGQTLIETLVACFILVMGITAALGLATYSFGAASSIKQQSIALGLAREGIEVVKNLRDTNWLRAGDLDIDCYNFSTNDATGLCYKDWLLPSTDTGTDINYAGGENTYTIRFDQTQSIPWQLVATDKDFGLNFNDLSDISDRSKIFYNGASGLDATEGNSQMARKITITSETFAPFNKDVGPRLKVTSQVWWANKNCAMTADVNPKPSCSVTLTTYLTNWRVF
jgi:type II secretory pathway pseudopilin PulG